MNSLAHASSVKLASLSLMATLAFTACGSDDKQTSSTTAGTAAATTTIPEDVIVPDSVVTAGLTKLPTTIAAAIAAIGTPEAKAKLAMIEQEWAGFEGTVRQNDTDLYLAIEDQLTPLQRQIEAGDSATAKTTAEALNGLFDQYKAKYP